MSGWLVINIRANPASRNFLQASRTPGSRRRSESDAGGYGLPSRSRARFTTPSRSRNTARRINSEPPRARIFEHGSHRNAERLTRCPVTGPTKALDAAGVQAHHRDIALPPTVTTGVLKSNLFFRKPCDLECKLGDFVDGDVVAGRDVVNFETLFSLLVREQHGGDDVFDMDVGFALRAVAQNAQVVRQRLQTADEIEADSMRLARPHHVAEAESAGPDSEHRAIRSDQCFARKLAGAISGNWKKRAEVLSGLVLAQISIHAAPRRVEQLRCTG